jgi:molecular chaperone DnaK
VHQRLKDAAEAARRALSAAAETVIDLPLLGDGPTAPLDLRYRLTRVELDALTADLVARVAEPCRRALAAAGLRPGDLDTLVLCGGLAHAPAVRAAVLAALGEPPLADVSPEEAVALGAAAFGSPQAARRYAP